MWSRHHEVKRDLNWGTDSGGSIGRIKTEQGGTCELLSQPPREGMFKDGCRSEPRLGEWCDREQKQCHPEKTDLVGEHKRFGLGHILGIGCW